MKKLEIVMKNHNGGPLGFKKITKISGKNIRGSKRKTFEFFQSDDRTFRTDIRKEAWVLKTNVRID